MSPSSARVLLGAALPLVTTMALFPQAAQASQAAPDLESGGANLAAATLAGCYDGAAHRVFQQGGWGGEVGTFTASTRCLDINVRNDSVFSTNACVVFVDKTNNCNYWTYLPAKSGFYVVATNVRDGAHFRVRFSNNFFQYDPLISDTAY
ncbi:hypothetical protein ACFFWC_04770 [Plantactinospora siamensis]|uniref:Uncharacterized protein n=1 Tax=Plantactinospora siamensis TaxID=555372 RepID=A0ABV6NRC4_9ACTN